MEIGSRRYICTCAGFSNNRFKRAPFLKTTNWRVIKRANIFIITFCIVSKFSMCASYSGMKFVLNVQYTTGRPLLQLQVEPCTVN